MQIDWDVPIVMDDGIMLRADVFRPLANGPHPVILSYGPYAKGLAFQEGYPGPWEIMACEAPRGHRRHHEPSTRTGRWSTPSAGCPMATRACAWTRAALAARRAGSIPSRRARRATSMCVEWAGTAPWSSGRIGLAGISYYAINQWHVASLQPPHLAAMCVWEGAADWYRDMTHHGGILCTFWANWYDMQVLGVQHGFGDRGAVNPNTGELVAGPETLSENELAASRCDLGGEILDHPLADAYHGLRSPHWSRSRCRPRRPPTGAARACTRAGTSRASCARRPGTSGSRCTARALDRVLHRLRGGAAKALLRSLPEGRGGRWRDQPRVQFQVRRLDRLEQRAEREWPARARAGSEFSLDLAARAVALGSPCPPSARSR